MQFIFISCFARGAACGYADNANATGDFGEIVYNLIRIDQMRKSDTDRRADFDDVYAFGTAFEPVFKLPKSESE